VNPTLDIRAIHTIRQPRQRTANVRDIRVRVTIGGTLERPLLSLDNPDNLPLSQSDLLQLPDYRRAGDCARQQHVGVSIAAGVGRDSLRRESHHECDSEKRARHRRASDGGYNTDARTTDPYYYNLLNTRAILGKQIGNQWFVGLSTGLCVVNASNFVENFGLKLEYRFNSMYSAQAGIEPGSSDLTCARSNASQIQQQTPRQFGFDLFRTWRF
jgi:hypothetical protein